MLNEEKLLYALNDVRDEHLEQTRKHLGYGVKTGKKVRPRRLGRVMVLVAMLSVLFVTTAYAIYRVSLASLRAGEYMGYGMSSLAGTMDSAEGQALKDWLEVLEKDESVYDYEQAQAVGTDYERYGAHNRALADSLDGILEQYGLALDTGFQVPSDEKSFYEAAGVGKLTRSTDAVENVFLSGYCYDSGAFTMEGDLYPVGADYAVGYQLVRSVKGVFSMAMANLGDAADYEEWSYETAAGDSLTLEQNPKGGAIALIETENGFAVLLIQGGTWVDHIGDGKIDGIGDEFVTLIFTKEEVENLVEGFRWAALEDDALGMEEDFTVPEFTPTGSLLDLVNKSLDLAELPEQDQYEISVVYDAQIAPYVDGFQLVDYQITHFTYSFAGWIAFTGTPKGELDWATVETTAGPVYCRSLCLLLGGEMGTFIPGPSFDMLPYDDLSAYRDIGENGEKDVVFLGRELKALASATLYVQQLNQSFTITGDRLDELKKLLQPGFYSGSGNCDTWNPLYLNFTDGTHAVVYTASDGSDGVRLYGEWAGYGYGKSLFELVLVPLDAAGYEKHDGLVTARLEEPESGFGAMTFEMDFLENGPMVERRVMSDMLRGRTWEYDAEGKCVRDYMWEGTRDNLSRDTSYTYREDGMLLETYSDSFSRGWEKTVYEYDALGRLTAEIHSDNDDAPGAIGGNIYYDYDADGNCRVTLGWQLAQQAG